MQNKIPAYYTIDNEPFDDYMSVEQRPEHLKDEMWLEICAAECAKDYWDNHDGWEASWESPIAFTLWRTDLGKEPVSLGTFNVSMEMTPSFNAHLQEA